METVFENAGDVVSFGNFVFFIIMFYLSLNRFFARGRKGRVLLFFLTLLVNPITCFFLSILLAGWVSYLYTQISGMPYTSMTIHESAGAMVTAGAGALIYLFIILLFACLLAKLMDNRFRSSTLFLFLMFNTLFLNQVREINAADILGIPGGMYLIYFLTNVLSFFILWFFYRHCIIPLSRLSLDGAKIEWKAFMIPPAVFILFYFFFDTAELLFDSGGVINTITLFSTVIVCLFV